ncbi:nocturnin isoform X2 [Triplophysa dalaica]|uniref:nocturnin isoform X2 n=1 Tax=Triplophysa dalaica TaxID=1582913 RepID=UPI0024DF7171|nr:nocturnin isoform X2 [Triplophysa dalaica]XP_056593728.1 nocturnin isoform X2 [Triplophysa dalaica]
MSILVRSMGSSTSSLYSALANTISSPALSQPCVSGYSPNSDLDFHQDPVDPLGLLRECKEVLRDRPARLHRTFVQTGHWDSGQMQIRVMQWNVLAQALGEGMDSFVKCPLDALNWPERKYLILEEILTHKPDILCLQEVDHYFDMFQPILASLGYQSSFCPKPWSPCLDVENNNGPDGCALFFNHKRFQLINTTNLRLSAMMLKTNQVAIVATLRCQATRRAFCVAVTHLKARSGWEVLRSAQGSDLLLNLRNIAQSVGTEENGNSDVPMIVCGDFNAEPTEDVYRNFATSSLGLDSAYKHLSTDGKTEPPYTTWKIRPSGESCHTLDYVWYSHTAFHVHAVLDFPTPEQIGPNRLPSYNYPSDHLSLVCDLGFKDLKPVC